MRDVDVVVPCEQIAHCSQIAASVCARQADLRRAIQSRSTTDHERAYRLAFDPAWKIDRCFSSEEVSATRKAKAKCIQNARRENMLLLHAQYLLTQACVYRAQWVDCRGCCGTVVNRIDGKRRILRGDVVIQPRRSKIFADALQWMIERFGNAASEFRSILHRP